MQKKTKMVISASIVALAIGGTYFLSAGSNFQGLLKLSSKDKTLVCKEYKEKCDSGDKKACSNYKKIKDDCKKVILKKSTKPVDDVPADIEIDKFSVSAIRWNDLRYIQLNGNQQALSFGAYSFTATSEACLNRFVIQSSDITNIYFVPVLFDANGVQVDDPWYGLRGIGPFPAYRYDEVSDKDSFVYNLCRGQFADRGLNPGEQLVINVYGILKENINEADAQVTLVGKGDESFSFDMHDTHIYSPSNARGVPVVDPSLGVLEVAGVIPEGSWELILSPGHPELN